MSFKWDASTKSNLIHNLKNQDEIRAPDNEFQMRCEHQSLLVPKTHNLNNQNETQRQAQELN